MRALDNNDKTYARRMASQARKEERAEPVQTNTERTPLELQEEAVKAAETDLNSKTQAFEMATEELERAKADKDSAQERLNKAKIAVRDAEDREMQARSKVNTAQKDLTESRRIYDQQVALLNELSIKKLVHISAIEGGLPSGKLYMSAYDYDQLSDDDKRMVTPISTDDSAFARYPDDFYMYPAKLGMEGYQSACSYALAYVKLILVEQDGAAVELVCNDETVKALATMQNT